MRSLRLVSNLCLFYGRSVPGSDQLPPIPIADPLLAPLLLQIKYNTVPQEAPMSHTNGYWCTRCNLTFPNGQGGRMYVLDGRGTRVICPHPGEEAEVARVLGVKEKALRCPCEPNTTKKAKHHQEVFHLALTRTGFLSDCICHDCLAQFGLDLQRDEKRCPTCSSSEVTTLHDLLGEPCPRCKEGTIGRMPNQHPVRSRHSLNR